MVGPRLRGILASVCLRNRRIGVRERPARILTTEGGEMTEASKQPKDKNYNLIAVLYQSSDNVESLKSYIQDAQQQGDQELVDFFDGILENNLRAAQRAKEMLVPRFQSEQE
jgi:hypothetical protein